MITWNIQDKERGTQCKARLLRCSPRQARSYRAYFALADILRRAQSDVLGAFGLGPQECRYEITESGSHWRLRDYPAQLTGPALLIVAAPIKRPYIWDLTPSVSAIRYCLREGLHVYLLEWLPDSLRNQNIGLDEYAEAISECSARIARDEGGTKPFLIGHSLGGTLAAISSALIPERIKGLVLLGAPLCFEPATSQFRDGLVALVPPMLSETGRFPGSLLSYVATLAAPGTFIWSRLMDAALSLTDGEALEIHGRVERWTLDEIPLPGRSVSQIIRWLYCENRFCRGTLESETHWSVLPACRCPPLRSSTRPTTLPRSHRSSRVLTRCR